MQNRRIMDLSGKAPTTRTNEAALETPNARVEQVGAFRVDALAASQAAVAEKYQGVDANAQVGIVAPRAGHIIGMAWSLSTAVTAGTATIQATVNATASGDTGNLASPATSTSGTMQHSTPIPFNAGDKLGVKHTTNAGFTPTPNLATWLLIRWTALEPATPDSMNFVG